LLSFSKGALKLFKRTERYIEMKNNDKILESIYTTIFSQKFSQDGTELAACDNYGHIGVYK
jgi:hypothetical protein